jgi:hypothetical protein
VNDHTAFRTDWMPFAGRRQSGYGIGGIPWSMHEMTQEKMDSPKAGPYEGAERDGEPWQRLLWEHQAWL